MILRLLTIMIRHRPQGKDDLAMLLAWLSSIGFTAASYISVRWGVGLWQAPPEWAVNAIKVCFGFKMRGY
jgi:hypothetical protein